MNNSKWFKKLFHGSKDPMEMRFANTTVVSNEDCLSIVFTAIHEVLEQIEDAKLSELGEVIEKLKEEYK